MCSFLSEFLCNASTPAAGATLLFVSDWSCVKYTVSCGFVLRVLRRYKPTSAVADLSFTKVSI